jgi:hypothetical protein
MSETRGRKPKPVEQKQRIGNPGKRKLAPVVTLAPSTGEIPEPHRPLLPGRDGTTGYGRMLWNQVWQAGGAWLRRDADLELVMMVCEQTDERTILRNKLFSGQLDWRERAALRHLEKQITTNLSTLGFSPTDRARMGIASQPVSSLGEFRSRVENNRKAK